MIWFQLFLSFLQIGLFSFGGGYAAMPLIQEQIVNIHGWLDMDQFTDLITISQMTPGPIAINSATFVGIRIGGIPGALVATLGCILPSCIIVTLLEISETGCTAECAEFSPPCGCCPDRFCRDLHPGHCFLGQRGSDPAGRYRLAPGGYFYRLCSAFTETEMESHPGHGAGGRYEAGSGGSTEMGILTQ